MTSSCLPAQCPARWLLSLCACRRARCSPCAPTAVPILLPLPASSAPLPGAAPRSLVISSVACTHGAAQQQGGCAQASEGRGWGTDCAAALRQHSRAVLFFCCLRPGIAQSLSPRTLALSIASHAKPTALPPAHRPPPLPPSPSLSFRASPPHSPPPSRLLRARRPGRGPCRGGVFPRRRLRRAPPLSTPPPAPHGLHRPLRPARAQYDPLGLRPAQSEVCYVVRPVSASRRAADCRLNARRSPLARRTLDDAPPSIEPSSLHLPPNPRRLLAGDQL